MKSEILQKSELRHQSIEIDASNALEVRYWHKTIACYLAPLKTAQNQTHGTMY